MVRRRPLLLLLLVGACALATCKTPIYEPARTPASTTDLLRETAAQPLYPGDDPGTEWTTQAADGVSLMAKYTPVRLTTELATLTEAERAMLPLLIEAASAMNDVFWQQSWGDRDALLATIEEPALRRFAEINYGPWDRLDGERAFVEGVGDKPLGARFYPDDVDRDELEEAFGGPDGESLRSLYTVVRRNPAGGLVATPYHVVWAAEHARAAAKLREAAALAEDPGLRRYLELRAVALETDAYRDSDLAWMEMKDNVLDIVIGPIETYEDRLLGLKAAHEAYVLVKDKAWSQRLARYAELLPDLQRGLPVPEAYKRESPGTGSDLNAYDVVFYAGDCNAGSKTIAINLPNDEEVQLTRGTRRLQLKNAMRAKYDEILVPLGDVLIAPEQRAHLTFTAFFGNTMFHEVAHGLGIKETVTGRGLVRQVLREHASAMEEGKADVLGLYMVAQLRGLGQLDEGHPMDDMVTFLAGIFRSVRFGASSAHGVANLIRFNYFQALGAFVRDEASGTYRVVPDRFALAVDALAEAILVLQGDGDYDAVAAFVERYGSMSAELRADLARLAAASIPVDVYFEQGVDVLGL